MAVKKIVSRLVSGNGVPSCMIDMCVGACVSLCVMPWRMPPFQTEVRCWQSDILYLKKNHKNALPAFKACKAKFLCATRQGLSSTLCAACPENTLATSNWRNVQSAHGILDIAPGLCYAQSDPKRGGVGMKLGANLQYCRKWNGNMTREKLAERMVYPGRPFPNGKRARPCRNWKS